MDTNTLQKLGLTESQAKGYLALINNGDLTPTELADMIHETRTNTYAIADKLVTLGLAIKRNGTPVKYAPESPAKLRQILVNQQQEFKSINSELSGVLPGLVSAYNLTTNKPGVLYLEGNDSLRTVYDDIIKEGKTIQIFPSDYDRDDPEMAALIDKQIKRQRDHAIKTEVIIHKGQFGAYEKLNDDLFEARPADFSSLDAQIILYGDNSAITTFNDSMVTTIITNKLITNTLRQLFMSFWQPT